MGAVDFLRRAVAGALAGPAGAGATGGDDARPPADGAGAPPGTAEAIAAQVRASRRRRAADRAEAMLREALAQKVLHAWAENRYQTLVPLALSLRSLDGRARGLVVEAMAAAAAARGEPGEAERRRLLGAVERLGGGEAERAGAAAALARPRPLGAVLGEAREAGLAAPAYAASLLAVDQRDPVNRGYLRYLAARLGLDEAVAHGLARRYRT